MWRETVIGAPSQISPLWQPETVVAGAELAAYTGEPEKSEHCCNHDCTPQKQLDASQDSLREEFEEEAVEIDCGVVDPSSAPDI